jgi:DNA primase
MPLEWSEVSHDLRLGDWTIKTVPEKLAMRKRDPWQGLLDLEPDLAAVLGRLGQR